MSTITPFKELYQADKATDPYWNRFVELGGFDKASKGYLANRLDVLLAQKFVLPKKSPVERVAAQKRTLLFVDGLFVPESSFFPEGQLYSLEEAEALYGTFIESRKQRLLPHEKSSLFTLNGALAKEALFIYIPQDSVIPEAVTIQFLYTKRDYSLLASPRLQMVVGKNVKITFLFEQHSEQDLCVNYGWDLQLEEGAKVDFVTLCQGSDEGFFCDALRATLKANSSLSGHIFSTGAKMGWRDYQVELIGPGAEAQLKAALNLPARRQEQIEFFMEHKAPHCRSHQHIKHVGYEATRHSFAGTIYVHEAAEATDSYQKHSALLLSPTAFSAVQPNLEIFNAEVKASHGATVGQLNQEALFYLISRGIARPDAEALLIEAHLQEITSSIEDSEIRARALKWVRGCG